MRTLIISYQSLDGDTIMTPESPIGLDVIHGEHHGESRDGSNLSLPSTRMEEASTISRLRKTVFGRTPISLTYNRSNPFHLFTCLYHTIALVIKKRGLITVIFNQTIQSIASTVHIYLKSIYEQYKYNLTDK